MDINKILAKFDELINEARTITEEGDKNVELFGDRTISPVPYYRLLSSSKMLFSYLNANNYNELLQDYYSSANRPANSGIIQGILESAKREFQFGILSHPKLLATADSMEDLLEQAEYLLDQDYKDAAAMLIGGTLETILRSMLQNVYKTIKFETKDGLRKFNEKLYKEGSAYDKATYKLIDGYAEIRNSAAHGIYESYSKVQVEEFLKFVRNFISNWFTVKMKNGM